MQMKEVPTGNKVVAARVLEVMPEKHCTPTAGMGSLPGAEQTAAPQQEDPTAGDGAGVAGDEGLALEQLSAAATELHSPWLHNKSLAEGAKYIARMFWSAYQLSRSATGTEVNTVMGAPTALQSPAILLDSAHVISML